MSEAFDLLIRGGTAATINGIAEADIGVFPSDARRIYDALAGTDKARAAVDTDHYFTTPGARDEQADTIGEWIAKRWP